MPIVFIFVGTSVVIVPVEDTVSVPVSVLVALKLFTPVILWLLASRPAANLGLASFSNPASIISCGFGLPF